MSYYDEKLVAEWSDQVLANGEKLLTPFRTEATEADHCDNLFTEISDFHGSRFLDVGGGMGALGDHWIYHCGVTVDLLNISQAQLDRAHPRHRKILANYEEYYGDGTLYDGIVVQSVAGHLDKEQMLRTSRALLKPGGWLMIVDMHPANDAGKWLIDGMLNYDTQPLSCWSNALAETDFNMVQYRQYHTDHPSPTFKRECGENYGQIAAAVRPFVLVAVKEG